MTDDANRGGQFGQNYYRQTSGLDELHRFNMHWWSVRFYALLARRILRRNAGRRVLEIGCAHGYTLAWLEQRFETVGVDVSDYAISRARVNAPASHVYVADVTRELPAEVAAGGFDLILAKYVLEHLPDPAGVVRTLAGLLSPRGRLLYSVPDLRSPSRRFRKDKWYAFIDPTHVSLLDAHAWLELTTNAGLVVERSFADGLWDMPWFARVPSVLQYATISLPTMIAVLLAAPVIPAGFGENLIVVARKA
jgi:2-polyprenyl-3-methyl-5-hydroxy-6-metoxy-1,4-benzoquinol methylase